MMLSLLLAMSAAVEPARVVTLPQRARPAVAMHSRKRTAPRTGARTVRSAKICVTGRCLPAAPSPYRLTGVTEQRYSGKMDVVAKDTKMACGVQGAPVCPGRGTQLIHTPID